MKVVFIISCISSKSKGLGGHYHSLLETVKALSNDHEISIISVGNIFPKALENFNIQNVKLIDLTYDKFKPFKTYKKIRNCIREGQFEVIHSFDRNAFYYGRMVSYFHKIPHVLTKCGGNNKGYLPYAKNLICFSKENFEFYKTQQKFRSIKLELIPNRISNFNSNKEKISEIKMRSKFTDGDSVILRISRIGNYYLRTNLNMISLVNQLNKDGVSCKGIIVGTIENESSFQKLKEHAGENIHFFTEDRFTKNAKEIIDCADVVVGTGRSMMEGMSKSKIGLSPMKEGDDLALVDKSTFDELFFYNFSERCQLTNFDQLINYNKIKELLNSKSCHDELRGFVDSSYNQYFDISKIPELHSRIYNNLKINSKPFLIDFIKHTLLQFKIHRVK